MSDIKVSEMTEATELNDNDLLMVVQNGANKKVKIEKIGISALQESLQQEISGIQTNLEQQMSTIQMDLEQQISDNKTNIEEKINTIGTYTTEEVDAGKKWIDGKIIYRKLVKFPATSTTDNKWISLSSLNIQRVISIYGIGTATEDGGALILPYIFDDNYATLYYVNKELHIATRGLALSNETYVTIEYTKND